MNTLTTRPSKLLGIIKIFPLTLSAVSSDVSVSRNGTNSVYTTMHNLITHINDVHNMYLLMISLHTTDSRMMVAPILLLHDIVCP